MNDLRCLAGVSLTRIHELTVDFVEGPPWLMLCMLALVMVCPLRARASVLLSPVSNWHYFKGTSTPAAQGGLTWKDPGFSTSGWSGPSPAPFAYGYNGYPNLGPSTNLGDMQNNYASVFLRQTFNVTAPGSITKLTLAVDYDDGFVAYLNGTEIARKNMPAGAVNNTTQASAAHEASHGVGSKDPQEMEYIEVNPALLVPGANVLAVSVHNSPISSTDLYFMASLNEGVNLTRGPFLQLPEASGVTVAWSTDAPVSGAVDWGSDPSCSDGTVEAPQAALRHTAHLPVPSDGNDYYYRVRAGDVVLADGVALRAPRTASQPWKAAIYGDFGGYSAPVGQLGASIHAIRPDIQLTVGDNLYNYGQPGAYDVCWFQPLKDSLRYAPLAPAVGNHDVDTRDGEWFQEYFTLPQNGPSNPAGQKEKNYSFDYANAHMVILDTEPFEDSQTDRINAIREWLRSDLASTTKKWKFVFLHRPPYTSEGSHAPQTRVRDELVPIFEQYGVNIVFQGHNHWYERIQPVNGVRYVTCGGGSIGRHSLTNRKIYSALVVNDRDSIGGMEIDGDKLRLKAIDFGGRIFDDLYLNLADPFSMNGLLDTAAPLRAQNGLKLYAAIKGYHLYVATQDAGEGGDNFIYVSREPGALKAAGWGKGGQIAAWDAFLADENDNGYTGWFNASGAKIDDVTAFQAVTSGINNNGPAGNGVLEGLVDMRVLWNNEIPQTIYLAGLPYGNGDSAALVTSAQVPAGNGNGNVEANEFLAVSARSLALDLPAARATGPAEGVEAGMPFTVNGSASENPSGLPLLYSWSQVSGPACLFDNAANSDPMVRATANPGSIQPAVLRLVVNDSRFDSDPVTVTVTIKPMTDTDGDGLSDEEEITGINNILTPADPAGHTSDPTVWDTDGDGIGDGAEALAGTDPRDAGSALRVLSSGFKDGAFEISWASVPGRTYQVRFLDNFSADHWISLGDPVTATETVTTAQDPMANPAASRYYRVLVEPAP